ncbi:PiggyBac transposable element-derived protein 4 [Plakobranchus ocellatus]|uniref:PiggyBac transposable element-derived protein 4 n=1 Tax=Plakobranchus ocellatus TaxID=259542 RepID=A0AAV3Z1L7_9GAST|nr:PiggyBac transposable element-derived protein 4 [Plakobranchus ocellatus]
MAKNKLTLIGTIKRNKTFLPTDFQEKKALGLHESKFLFRNETTLVSFQSKRNSAMHNKAAVSENGKPEIVLAYNETKGGVDAMNQMAHAFTTRLNESQNGGLWFTFSTCSTWPRLHWLSSDANFPWMFSPSQTTDDDSTFMSAALWQSTRFSEEQQFQHCKNQSN